MIYITSLLHKYKLSGVFDIFNDSPVDVKKKNIKLKY